MRDGTLGSSGWAGQLRRLILTAMLILALGGCGNLYVEQLSNIENAALAPVPQPTGLTAVAGDGEVALSWTDPATPVFANLELTWSPGDEVQRIPPGQESYTADGLSNGTLYTFSLAALNSNGDRSEPVSASAVPNPPSFVAIDPTTVSATEGGARGSYDVVLAARPTDDVIITVTPGSEVTVSPETLTFTPENWESPQAVSVTAVDDALEEGNHSETVAHAVSSSDPSFDGIELPVVSVTIVDNDAPGVSVSPITLAVSEGGSGAGYEIVLTTEPSAEVEISLSPGTDIALDASVLTFSPTDWDTVQTVLVTAVDDLDIEGAHTDEVFHTATSADPGYDGVSTPTVNVDVADNDVVDISVSTSSVAVNEGGAGGSFTLVLTQEPTAPVAITLTPDAQIDLGAGAGNGVNRSFDATNWDIPETIAVTAVDDIVFEGSHNSSVSFTVSSSDPRYDSFAVSDVTVTISDDEQPLSIYAVAVTTLYRWDDMAGSNQVTYDGSVGTAFTNSTNDLYVDGSHIYVSDRNNGLFYRFDDMTGTNQLEYNPGGNPYGISVYLGGIYTASFGGSIYRFEDMSGLNQTTYDGLAGGTQFSRPTDIHVAASGIYVTELDNQLLYRFDDLAGTGQVEYNGGGAFQNLRDVVVDSSGRIYVVDLTNALLYRFDDMAGTNLVTYDGSAGTTFSNPGGLAIDSLDRIYVADNGTDRIYRFDDMSGTNQVELPLTSVSDVFVFGP